MPNGIGPTGLTTATQAELVSDFTTAFETIYGADINLDPSTPDGQMMMIFIQVILDVLDLVRQVNAQFDPDQAIGVLLDQRVGINGIQRQAGTYTVTNITVVTSKALTLPGLDLDEEDPYTISDNAGNKWQLVEREVIASAGTYVLAFRAEFPGSVLTTPNTITVPVSIVLGVSSVNNPTTYTTLGVTEETDAGLKIRRQKSVSLSSQGYLKGLLSSLENINGLTSAFVYENNTSAIDGDGIPAHSIWVIVQGGDAESIANAIYSKRNAGCNMYGTESYIITQEDGSPFIVNWDEVIAEPLFIKFTTTSLDGENPPDIAAIRAGLVESFVPGVYQKVNINDLATDVQAIDDNTLVTGPGFSLSSGGSYTNTLLPSSKNKQFAVSAANIIILPMILSPVTVSVVHALTQQFTALGGYGTLTYSISVNNSGGSINSVTGLYTAGATPATDTVHCVDGLGNTCNATVIVT